MRSNPLLFTEAQIDYLCEKLQRARKEGKKEGKKVQARIDANIMRDANALEEELKSKQP